MRCMTWQLQEAKNKFSEVVDTALESGPQIISRRGHNTVVVMGYKEYLRMRTPTRSIKKSLAAADFSELTVERDASTSGRGTTQAQI